MLSQQTRRAGKRAPRRLEARVEARAHDRAPQTARPGHLLGGLYNLHVLV